MIKMLIEKEKLDGQRNMQMILAMNNSVMDVTEKFNKTVDDMSKFMEEQLTLQRDLMKTAGDREVRMEARQREREARTREWTKSVQDTNRQYFERLAERINDAMKSNEETARLQREMKEEMDADTGCVIL